MPAATKIPMPPSMGMQGGGQHGGSLPPPPPPGGGGGEPAIQISEINSATNRVTPNTNFLKSIVVVINTRQM